MKGASYDADGNIRILGSAEKRTEPVIEPFMEHEETMEHEPDDIFMEQEAEPVFMEPETPSNAVKDVLWEEIEERIVESEKKKERRQTLHEGFRTLRRSADQIRGTIADLGLRATKEGTEQWKWTTRDAASAMRNFRSGLGSGLRSTWTFLRQPVWVPRPRKEPKQYKRGTLFFIDTVRFGTTFAMLFGVLFVSLNYQSFWQILQSRIDPLSARKNSMQLETELHPIIGANPDARSSGDILSYLPLVGPPSNRLIIPKLGLNVPIVQPSNTSLLKEDWAQLEEDIQTALEDGVVHYPGTAVAGQAGNFFVTGHSSYYPLAAGNYKTVFARLHDLDVGDEYWVYYGGDKHRYRIIEEKEVSPNDVSVLDQPTDKRLSTLMTCTPTGTTLRRLIHLAQEIDPVTGVAMTVGQHATAEALPKMRAELLPI